MKRFLALSLVLAIAIAGLCLAQGKKHLDAVSPNAVLDAAADFQRDLSYPQASCCSSRGILHSPNVAEAEACCDHIFDSCLGMRLVASRWNVRGFGDPGQDGASFVLCAKLG